METICIDASVVAKWYLPEDQHEEAKAILLAYEQRKIRLVAPILLLYEVGSVLRERINNQELNQEEALAILFQLKKVNISLVSPVDSLPRTLEIAVKNNLWIYDASYIAVAEMYDGKFFTADTRLVSRVKTGFPSIRHLEEIKELKG